MFCLECGTEMAIRARACPTCGHVYGDRERSLAEPPTGHAVQGSHVSPTSAMPGTPAAVGQAASPVTTVKYVGELNTTGLPRDLPGRFVLGISLGMAADLLLPWVSVNGSNVTPSSIGAPVIVVVALLAAATLPVFTTSLRQHPVWSALPLIVGAFCAGIAGSVWLLLAPLAQIFAISFGSDPSNLTLSPQGGLYLFLLGSAVLLTSGQRMLVATHEAQVTDARRDAIRATQAKNAVAQRTMPAMPVFATPGSQASDGTRQQGIPSAAGQASVTAEPAPLPRETTAASGAPAAPILPVLPGSEAWNQAPAVPAPLRQSPGGGWGKSRGPQRLR